MTGPPIPKLPGYTATAPILPSADKAFNKAQTLHYTNGYSSERPLMLVDQGDSTQSCAERLQATNMTSTAKSTLGSTRPKWVEYDRKVLRFYGYFQESVVESRCENHRIRKVVIYYYLEDDTIHVAEPKEDNSGLPQGVFIKRSKVFKEEGVPYEAADFVVGDTVKLFGRTIFIIDCDKFTKNYLCDELGLEVGPTGSYPTDPIHTYKETYKRTQTGIPPNPRSDDLTRFLEAKLGKPPNVLEEDRLKQFLDNNRRVLRFWCLWDDRSGLYGDRRPYVIHYFLEDDTGEVLESQEANSGRDPFPVFLKRGPLLKEQHAFMSVTNRTHKEQCYGPEDFRIGSTVCIQNRNFFIFDCDAFTRSWYAENFGYSEVDLKAVDIAEGILPFARPALPPHNGYGTLEDSQQNCTSLLPKPPKKDFHKLMNKDSIVLRFSASLTETERFKLSVSDQDRKFIVSYFMADDTISVYEPPLRNSGIIGGKFLERSKLFKPNVQEAYMYYDLYVGAVLDIHHRGFKLLEADEYTYTYMENNRHVFVMADADALLQSFSKQVLGCEEEVRKCFIEFDTDGSGHLSEDELEGALKKAGFKFTMHQAVALRRRMDKDKNGTVDIEEFLASIGVSKQA